MPSKTLFLDHFKAIISIFLRLLSFFKVYAIYMYARSQSEVYFMQYNLKLTQTNAS